MSYYQQRNHSKLSIGQDGNTLTLLLAINLTVFAILAFIKVIYYFSFNEQGVSLFNQQVFRWFSLPADVEAFISRPWTLITHMFVHDTAAIQHREDAVVGSHGCCPDSNGHNSGRSTYSLRLGQANLQCRDKVKRQGISYCTSQSAIDVEWSQSFITSQGIPVYSSLTARTRLGCLDE